MLTARRCPACEGRVARGWGHANGIYLLRCKTCRTVYTADITVEDFAEEYEDYYTDANLHFPAFVGTSLDRTFAGFERYRQTGRLIDVGFGAASAMEAAARAGWEAEGIEVSKPAVEHARSLGFAAFHGHLHEAGYSDSYFDVAVISEVLEHVGDPRGLLQEIARVVRPGGLLWATTPHGRGISARLLGLEWSVVVPPEHLQLFSRGGLRELVDSTGFRTVAIKTEAVNPFEILHRLRRKASLDTASMPGFDRVQSSYAILEKLYSRPSLRYAKDSVNRMLSATRMGDSLKIWAERRA